MAGPHGDWPSSTTTRPVVPNQVSPGHPSGGYNPNQQVSPGHPSGGYNPNQNIARRTGITQTTVDPYDEKGDYMDWDYVNPNTGKTAGQLQAELELVSKTNEKNKIQQTKDAQSLAADLRSRNINKETLQSDMDSGKITEEMSQGLESLQLMQDEGVYGGVSGNEAITNKAKGSLVNKLKRLQDQASQGAWGEDFEFANKQIMRNLMESDEWKAVGKLFGSDILGAVNTFGVKGAMGMINPNTGRPLIDSDDPATKNFFSQTAKGSDVGYDPTGTKTFSGLTEDEYKNKFLKRGELWDDPLSGILNAKKPTPDTQWGRYNRPTLIDQRRERQRQLFYGPKASPIKDMEQSGFMNTMGSKMDNPYLKDMMDTLKSGLYSKTYVNPSAGFKPWGLEQHYATGQRSPLHKNVARGGIMSVWNDRR